MAQFKLIKLTDSFKAKDESGNTCWIDEFTEFQDGNPHELATGAKFHALRTGERLYQLSATEYETGELQERRITRVEDT